MKFYPWAELAKDKLECRAYCPKCGQSKMFEGFKNAFWLQANSMAMSTQCDSPKCHSFMTIKITKDGVTVF